MGNPGEFLDTNPAPQFDLDLDSAAAASVEQIPEFDLFDPTVNPNDLDFETSERRQLSTAPAYSAVVTQ
jgi:hypothetical protein